MSKIRIELPDREEPCTGKSISFVAPCDCTVTECIQIEGQDYAVVDAIGRTVTGVSGVWATGALVTVTLNCEDKKAYIQNCAKPALAIADITGLSDSLAEATQSKAGRMSAADKKKLDGIADGANKISIDSELSDTSTNPVQNKVIKKNLDEHTHSEYLPTAGGTMTGSLKVNGMILTEGVDYGKSFPTSGNVVGKLFLLKR